MERGHREEELRPKDLPPTHGEIATRYPAPVEEGHQESGGQVLPAAELSCNDSPLFKGQVGETDSDRCWWSEKSRQSREHLFKECTARTVGIKRLWTAVGEAPGGRERTDELFKGRKRFGYRVRQARARPSNTSIRDLLSDDRYTEAVLDFLRDTRVGEVKAESLCI